MREGVDREDARARRGRLAHLARATAASRRSPGSTRARWCATSATRARCAAACSRRRSPEAEAARARSAPSRRWPAATWPARSRPREPVILDGGDGPLVVGIDTGIKDSIVRNLRERGVRLELHPCTTSAERAARARAPTPSSSPTAPATRPRSTTSSTRVRERGRQGARVGHLPRPPAALPGGRPRDLQAALRPPRRQPPGQGPRDRAGSRSPPRTTASRCSAPAASRRIDTDEPVRWETDFGAAELQQLNLYDRTVEGLVLRDVPGVDRPVPPRGRARAPRRPAPLRPLPGAAVAA